MACALCWRGTNMQGTYEDPEFYDAVTDYAQLALPGIDFDIEEGSRGAAGACRGKLAHC